ncbi:MAG: YbhB/YbcL family Raf kinase inhibitor-like protein [Chloroflexi bacterium]|nr:YbhB/YbcL family Raf kinase inhibitor-like protein [Chloroflexota bacterium]
MKIVSPAFEQNAGIPELYTCKGEDISPPLRWSGVPDGTVSLVLIMDDPDAPVGTWDHWVLFNLPANTSELAEDAQAYPEGTRLGRNSWKRNEYGGPCPPGGARHRYYFKLYALDVLLDLPEGAGKAQIEAAMRNHILAQAELIGIYKP